MERAFADGRQNQVRQVGRSPLEELRDYPFFAPDEEETRQQPWLHRFGPFLLAALLLVLALEVALLVVLP